MRLNPAIRLAFALLLLLQDGSVVAQSDAGVADAYPARPVRIVVPVAPGGILDIHGRLFSQKFAEQFGQQFIVDNRAGGGSLIGFLHVARAAPDGYTLLYTSTTITVLSAFLDKPEYDPIEDFAPLSLLTKGSYMVIVHPSVPARSMAELIAYARSRPGVLNWGLTGLGTPHHLGATWIMNDAKIKMTLIPYKGGGPMQIDLLSGQLQASFATLVSALPYVKSGKLRVVGVTSTERFKVLPDVPTIAESGVPGFDVSTWHGMFAPRGAPEAIGRRINAALVRFIRSPDVLAKLAADGLEPVASTAGQFRDFIAIEVPRWRQLVKDTGARLEQ